MNRRFVLVLTLFSLLALVAGASGSRASEPAPVLAPATDTNPGPTPPPIPIQVIVCPIESVCIECGQPGLICCLPGHDCIVVWIPILFRTPGDAVSDRSAVLAPLRMCNPATTPPP